MAHVSKIVRAPIAGRASGPRTSLVNPLVGPPRVTLGDALGSIASGFEALAQAEHEDDVKRDNIKAVQVEGAFQREVDAGLAQLDPLASDYADRVQDLLNSAKETATSGADFLTSDVAEITDKRLTAQVESFRTLAQQDRRTAIEKVAINERRQGMDTALANIRKDPGAVGVYITKFTQDLQRLNTSISPLEQLKFADEFSDATLIAQVEGLALAGRFNEARDLADLQETELSPKQFRALKKRIRSIETQGRQDSEVENASEIADLEIAVLNEADPDKARGMVEAAQERGLFAGKENKRVVLERSILAKEKKQRELAEERATILLKVPTGLDSQDEADKLWAMIVENQKPLLDTLQPEEREAALLQMAVNLAPQIGYLPTPLKRIIENAEHVEDPAVLARAGQYYDAIRAVAPGINMGAGDRAKGVSAAVERLGFKYEDAASYILQRFPDEKVLAFRVKIFDTVNEDFVAKDQLAELFDVDAGQVPDQAAIKYEQTLRLMFNQSGDMAVAQEVTNRTMKERFGLTSVGTPDSAYLTEFPPERFTPGVAGTSLTQTQAAMIYSADAARGLDALGIQHGITVEGAESSTADLIFVVSPKTRRDIAEGKRPEYDVYVLNSFGIPSKTAMTYVMPTTKLLLAIPEYAAIADEAKAVAADRRARNKASQQGIAQGEGPGASSGIQTPGIPQGPGPTQFKLPGQGLPPGAQGVLTGTGGA